MNPMDGWHWRVASMGRKRRRLDRKRTVGCVGQWQHIRQSTASSIPVGDRAIRVAVKAGHCGQIDIVSLWDQTSLVRTAGTARAPFQPVTRLSRILGIIFTVVLVLFDLRIFDHLVTAQRAELTLDLKLTDLLLQYFRRLFETILGYSSSVVRTSGLLVALLDPLVDAIVAEYVFAGRDLDGLVVHLQAYRAAEVVRHLFAEHLRIDTHFGITLSSQPISHNRVESQRRDFDWTNSSDLTAQVNDSLRAKHRIFTLLFRPMSSESLRVSPSHVRESESLRAVAEYTRVNWQMKPLSAELGLNRIVSPKTIQFNDFSTHSLYNQLIFLCVLLVR